MEKTYQKVVAGPVSRVAQFEAFSRMGKVLLNEDGHVVVSGKKRGINKSTNEVSVVKGFVDNGQHFTNGRKNSLRPNIRYRTGEYEYLYETDHMGRISKFETENLQLTKREERLPHSKNTPGKVKGQDHAGHLAGDRFGGSPKLDNLVSQLSDVN
ncbi:DNA/RNA non-specific endonuclease [Rossellomorea vietnamensis]|uniref:DNA/RNA non-specific endonuclease n=1 Tax=Rossellomorea vietnamensis TaxID=218284 RepID=UPI001E4ED3F2|nr:DNA/RNA non-specific endonuclease [Rossellomorea vietnamensis]